MMVCQFVDILKRLEKGFSTAMVRVKGDAPVVGVYIDFEPAVVYLEVEEPELKGATDADSNKVSSE